MAALKLESCSGRLSGRMERDSEAGNRAAQQAHRAKLPLAVPMFPDTSVAVTVNGTVTWLQPGVGSGSNGPTFAPQPFPAHVISTVLPCGVCQETRT